jgi:catechol 2,3-dioxygenase-like lactoylglutathione lyase family enzyme
MAGVTGIGGVFFRARDPQALRAWYAAHLGLEDGPGGAPWRQAAGHTVFAPFPADTDYFPATKAFMLNFRVDDLDALMSRLAAAGIAVETRPEEWDGPHGRFARIHDPEGNAIELWQSPG